ncbi:MAG: DUF4349 domain-containing protein [Alphaproteobacteria bacterium]|nr:DUF4349 domain-containing protein [Alphaproteobacteria bacterium]
MLRHFVAAGLAAVSLAACGNGGNARYEAAAPPPPPESAPMPVASIAAKAAYDQAPRQTIDQQSPGGGDSAQASDDRQIAYTYSRTLEVPTKRMQDLMDANRAACEAAGPAKCYVSNSQISGLGGDNSSGMLELHATPDWLKTFLDGLPESLKPFDALLDASNTSSEDLTVQIVDTSARLNSSKMLRERLNGLLKDRPGKLSDLLDIERELARVQAEIDSTESVIAALKARVAMSTLTLNYEARYTAVSRSIWRPLADAFSGFLPNLVSSLAAVIEFISYALLWIVLLAGLVWGGLALLRRRARARDRRRPPADPPPPLGPKGPRPVET